MTISFSIEISLQPPPSVALSVTIPFDTLCKVATVPFDNIFTIPAGNTLHDTEQPGGRPLKFKVDESHKISGPSIDKFRETGSTLSTLDHQE